MTYFILLIIVIHPVNKNQKITQVNHNASNDWATVFISTCNESTCCRSQKQNSLHFQVPFTTD